METIMFRGYDMLVLGSVEVNAPLMFKSSTLKIGCLTPKGKDNLPNHPVSGSFAQLTPPSTG